MGSWVVDGVTYDFPDGYTEDAVMGILLAQNIISAQPPPDLPRLPAAPLTPFQPPGAISAGIRQAAAEEAEAEAAEAVLPAGADIGARIERTTAELVEAAEKPRQAGLQAGRLDEPMPVETGGIPLFRRSAIQTVPAFVERQPTPLSIAPFVSEEAQRLTREEEQRAAASFDFPTPLAPSVVGQVPRRAIADAATGELRTPTTLEEVRESFAQQPVMTEEQARRAERDLAAQQREIDKRIEAGEDLGFFERNPGSFLGEVLTQPDQGAGIVETPLGAGLRSVLGYVSALAGEGYFGGLGYEVDSNGIPLDPDDFGFKIAQLREAAGLPEVYVPATGGGYSTIPMPGFATRREQVVPTPTDPTGSRRVDPDADGFALRVAQAVAKGRTLGDDYASAPAVRDYYEATFNDPDAAYFAGLIPEIFSPAGPGTAARAGKAAAGAVISRIDAQPFLQAVAAAEAASRAATTAADFSSPAGRAAIEAGQSAQRSASLLASPVVGKAADFVAAVKPGKAADGRLVRRVAERVLDRSGLGSDLVPAKAAIKPSSNTIAAVMADIRGALPAQAAPLAARIERQILRNTPDDFTLVTDTLAVPRSFAQQARQRLSELRTDVFFKDTADMAADLDALADGAEAAVADALRSAARQVAAVAERADGSPVYGFKGLDRRTRTAVQSALRRAGADVTSFEKRTPADFARAEATALNKQAAERLSSAADWSEVAAADIREAVKLRQTRGLQRALPGQLRNTRDLTAAQLRFRSADAGLMAALQSSKTLSSPTFRRLRAALSRGTLTETASGAMAAQRIRQASQEAMRTLSRQLYQLARQYGSVDEAMTVLLKQQLVAAGVRGDAAWKRVLGNLYGEAQAEEVLSLMQRYDIPADGYPSVDAIKALDLALTQRGDLPGLATTLPGFAPDYHRAFLKTVMEEGIRRTLIADRRIAEAAGAGVDVAEELGLATPLPAGFKLAQEQIDALKRTAAVDPLKAKVDTEAVPLALEVGPRHRVYDTVASQAERALAESGEEFAQFIESVPVRQRGSVQDMARSTADFLLATGRRNAVQRLKYGYIVPNLPYLTGRLIEAPLVSLATIGAADTARGAAQLVKRRVSGGGVTTASGVRYTPEQLEDLARQYPLGLARSETERVGSLAGDMLRDAKRAAATPAGKAAGFVVDYVNPVTRSFYQRSAEALELNYRRAVFEARLAAGDEPLMAARKARASQFDFDEVPGPVRDLVGKYLATASHYYKLMAELGRLIKDNPKAATAALKTQRERARVQDPFNLHGDKGLKTLGIVDLGEDGSFYGPAVPFLAPVERTLATMRGADIAVRSLRDTVAAVASGDLTAPVVAMTSGGQSVLRSMADEAIPAVLDLYEASTGGKPYTTQDIEGAQPLSDEKMFWAMALAAHHADPTRELGDWDAFLRFTDPKRVQPPAEAAHPTIDGAWIRQPAEGTPHLFWGRDDAGLPVYYVFEPSDKGLQNIQIARAVTPDRLEQVLPLAAVAEGRIKGTADGRLDASALLPTTLAGAAATALAEPTSVRSTERGISEQIEAIRRISEEPSAE